LNRLNGYATFARPDHRVGRETCTAELTLDCIGSSTKSRTPEARKLRRELEHERRADIAAQHAATIERTAFDELAEVMAQGGADGPRRAGGIVRESHRQLVNAARRLDWIGNGGNQIANLIP